MRDRLIALSIRWPLHILTSYDYPILTIDDFDIAEIPYHIGHIASYYRYTDDLDI